MQKLTKLESKIREIEDHKINRFLINCRPISTMNDKSEDSSRTSSTGEH